MQIQGLKKDPSLQARQRLEILDGDGDSTHRAQKMTDAVDLMIQINNYGKKCFERMSK